MKPPEKSCDGNYRDENGNKWTPDDPRTAATFHGGNSGFRSPDGTGGGSQCFHYPDTSDPVRDGGYQGTYDYSNPDTAGKWDHIWDDVFPHLFDQNYATPDPTTWY